MRRFQFDIVILAAAIRSVLLMCFFLEIISDLRYSSLIHRNTKKIAINNSIITAYVFHQFVEFEEENYRTLFVFF